MLNFTYKASPAHVVFGSGTIAQLPDLIRERGGQRVLLLSTPQQADQVRALGERIGALAVGYFDQATMHTPIEITEQAMEAVRAADVDCVLSFGGGSTIGLGKAIALRRDILHIAIPTTYAGSEMTPILGQTEHGRKTTQRTLRVLPQAVLYDVDFTLSLPPGLSGTSGINAIAHAVEGLYAQDTNPIMQLIALEGIRALVGALPKIVKAPEDRDARSEALYGAWLCGTVLGHVGMALHHKLCHTIGGSFNLPHAETHTVLLPHALAYNAPAVPDAIARLKPIFGGDDPAEALFALAGAVDAPRSLKDIGMPEAGIAQAAEEALQNAYWNPRALEREAIAALIARAWAGERPHS